MSPGCNSAKEDCRNSGKGEEEKPVVVRAIAGNCSPEKKERDENAGVLGSRCRELVLPDTAGHVGILAETWEEQNGGS